MHFVDHLLVAFFFLFFMSVCNIGAVCFLLENGFRRSGVP